MVVFGCVAADVHSVDAAVGLAGVHQVTLNLDVSRNSPDHLNAAARYDSEGAAAVWTHLQWDPAFWLFFLPGVSGPVLQYHGDDRDLILERNHLSFLDLPEQNVSLRHFFFVMKRCLCHHSEQFGL